MTTLPHEPRETGAANLTAPDARMDIYAAAQTLVTIKRRRRLNLHIAGEGSPTVILSPGLGGATIDWARVHPHVARFTRVVAHDHAGLGFSDPGRLPRSAAAIVADLRAALAAAEIGPPYILVGHSAGGLHMRLFAALHPDDVAGLVLVDGVTEYFDRRGVDSLVAAMAADRAIWRRLLAMAKAGDLSPDTPEYRLHVGLPRPDLTPAVNRAFHHMRTRPSYYRTLISESQALCGLTSAQIAAAPALPADLPLRVLSAGRIGVEPFLSDMNNGAQAWFAMHDDLVRLSTRGVRRTIDCGHNIPIEQPRAVVEAIREIVDLV